MRISDWSSDVCSSDLFAPQKARRDDAVEEYLAAARRKHRVAEFVPPDHPPALLRVGGDQRRLRMLRLQIMDDRARIGQQEPRIVHRRHLAERRGSPESWVGIADRDALPFEPDPLLAQIAERSEEHTSDLQSLMRNSYAVF